LFFAVCTMFRRIPRFLRLSLAQSGRRGHLPGGVVKHVLIQRITEN
jgi:hypothetical protein